VNCIRKACLRPPTAARVREYVAASSAPSLDRLKERYAVGVGVALLLLKDSTEELAKKGTISDKVIAALDRQQPKAALAVMPAFVELSKAAGLDVSSDADDS